MKIRLNAEALENYGSKYAGLEFEVTHVAWKYMPAEDFYKYGMPDGFHPGYDESMNGMELYDCEGLPFSVYEWEVEIL